MTWIAAAVAVATEIAKSYQQRKEQEDADNALANKLINAVKQELNSVKVEIFDKLNDLQKEELQGLVRGYLNNLELYKIGMPNEIDWLQSLVRDANLLCGQIYVIFKRYLSVSDYFNSRDFMALYTPVVSSYIYLLNEIRIRYQDDNSVQIINTIKTDVLPGVNEFLELLEKFTKSRFSVVHEKFQPEPHPDERLSTMLLYYDVQDGVGNFLDLNIMDYVKHRQEYKQRINKLRDEAITAEINKVINDIGILIYTEKIIEISDDLISQIAQPG